MKTHLGKFNKFYLNKRIKYTNLHFLKMANKDVYTNINLKNNISF